MIVSPALLTAAAEKAGISVPENPREYSTQENQEKHFHFFVFCMLQLARPLRHWGEHWDNAKVLAGFSKEELESKTVNDLIEAGFSHPYN